MPQAVHRQIIRQPGQRAELGKPVVELPRRDQPARPVSHTAGCLPP
jgi:hypothetical protein